MPAKFEGVLTEYGFDKNATPSWLMVPDKGFKRIRLTNAANVTLSSTSPSIATIEEAPSSKVSDLNREFLINGKMKGTTFIEARQGGALVARLEVAVKVKKTVNVAFNFVEDNAGHKTSRTAASISNWIDEINKIYL